VEEVTYENENVIRQANPLVKASYSMPAWDKKVVLHCVREFQKNKSLKKEYAISYKELSEFAGERSYTSKEMTKKVDAMKSHQIKIRTENGYDIIDWFSKISGDFNNKKVIFFFNEHIIPHLRDFTKGEFTTLIYESCGKLGSIFSLRLLEILSMNRFMSSFELGVKELKEQLELIEADEHGEYLPETEKLKSISRFEEKVLKVAKKDLKKNSDIYFDYEFLKKDISDARIKTHIKFKIYTNSNAVINVIPKNFKADKIISYFISSLVNVIQNGRWSKFKNQIKALEFLYQENIKDHSKNKLNTTLVYSLLFAKTSPSNYFRKMLTADNTDKYGDKWRHEWGKVKNKAIDYAKENYTEYSEIIRENIEGINKPF
jgi:hypothetical protein